MTPAATIPADEVVGLLTTHAWHPSPDPETAVRAVEAVRDAAICAAAEDATFDPDMVLDLIDRNQPPPEPIIHTLSRSGFGADWSLASAIEFATTLGAEATWVRELLGHNLQITAAGRTFRFKVPGPAAPAGSPS